MTTYAVLRLKLNTTSQKQVLEIINTYWRKLAEIVDFEESDILLIDADTEVDLNNARFHNVEMFSIVNYLYLKEPWKIVYDNNKVYYLEYILCQTDYDGFDDAYATQVDLNKGLSILNALRFLNDDIIDFPEIVVYNDFGNEYVVQEKTNA